MARVPNKEIDYTSRDYDGFKDLLIAKLQEKIPEYTDTSETDAGIVILEAFANGLDILSLYLDVTANDVVLPTTQDRRLATILARCLGYTPYNQTASEYRQVFVLDEIKTSDYLIPRGTVVRTEQTSSLVSMPFEVMEDTIIPAGYLGNETDSSGNYIYSARIQHGLSINNDILGNSNGTPIQTFKLTYTNVLVDSIQLYVNDGYTNKLWTLVDNFIDSTDNSEVFICLVDEFDVCTIEFGNGINGKIPTNSSIISANYRIGGGSAANVNANTITHLETQLGDIEETYNTSAIVLGHDKESLESIKINAPAVFRSRNRLVTLQDYSDLLRINFYEFNSLVSIRDSSNNMNVLIYYMLREGYSFSQELQNSIKEFIDARCMIGTSYSLINYVEEPINMNVSVYIDKDYNSNEIKGYVESYISSVIFRYGELKFGDYLVKSNIENEIKDTFDGILSVRITLTPTDVDNIIKPTNVYNILTEGTTTVVVQTL